MLRYQRVGFRYAGGGGIPSPGAQRAAVTDVDLTIAAGSLVLLVGASGSGKSTLVRMANGLIPHFHAGIFTGTVTVHGADTRAHTVRDLARHAGVVFQDHEAQLFNATVRHELAFGPRNQGLSRETVAARVAWAAEQTGIAHLLARPTTHLSGGERARVAVACVLAMQPPLLVLDEPSAALDPVATASLWNVLASLHHRGTTIAVAEHRPGRLWEDAETVAAMHDGTLVAQGAPNDVLRMATVSSDLPVPSVARLFMDAGLPERPRTVAAAAALVWERSLALVPRPGAAEGRGGAVLIGESLGYRRDDRAVLTAIDVRLHHGETVALVGPNGAGKTTLLRLLAGLARPYHGHMTGENGTPLPRYRFGLLLQHADDALFCRTVREEIEFSARTLARHDPRWIDTLIALLDLAPLLERPPLGLSDGEKRRVALAAMLAHRPAIVLLDEPTAGQDRERRDALAAIFALLRAEGAGVLIATHDLEFAAAHCPRWLVLSDGVLLADAPPASVLSDPALLARAHLLPTPIANLATALGVPYPGERARLIPAHEWRGGSVT